MPHHPSLLSIDPLSSRYLRLNKGGCVSSSPCTSVQWVPSSRSLFLVSHADGTIIVYDREREDPVTFTPRDPSPNFDSDPLPIPANDPNDPVANYAAGSSPTNEAEWDPLTIMIVTPGPSGSSQGAAGGNISGLSGGKEKVLRNPVSHWKISRKTIHGWHPPNV
jgi:hypothetical protein